MKLLPIHLNEDGSNPMLASDDCQELIRIYNDYYPLIGYHEPWIGYFVVKDDIVVGSCGFTGPPKDGQVEIAYYTFKRFEGLGISSFSCQQLVAMAQTTNSKLWITAKTVPEPSISSRILEKNGFHLQGVVQDHEIGDAWLWIIPHL